MRKITGENFGQDPVKWQEWYEQSRVEQTQFDKKEGLTKKIKIKLTPQQKRKLLQMSSEDRRKFIEGLAERKVKPLRDKLLKRER